MTFNELSRTARTFLVASAFSDAAARIAHRAITTLAHRLLQVARCSYSGSLTVKVVYRDGELKNVFVQQDDEAPEIVAFNS